MFTIVDTLYQFSVVSGFWEGTTGAGLVALHLVIRQRLVTYNFPLFTSTQHEQGRLYVNYYIYTSLQHVLTIKQGKPVSVLILNMGILSMGKCSYTVKIVSHSHTLFSYKERS